MSEISKLFCEVACHGTEHIESCKTVCEPCSQIGLELWESGRYEESPNRKNWLFGLGLLAFIGTVCFGHKIGRR